MRKVFPSSRRRKKSYLGIVGLKALSVPGVLWKPRLGTGNSPGNGNT